MRAPVAYAPAKPDAPYAAAPTGWAQHGVVEVTPASWAHRSDDPLAIVTTPVCESALLVVVLSRNKHELAVCDCNCQRSPMIVRCGSERS